MRELIRRLFHRSDPGRDRAGGACKESSRVSELWADLAAHTSDCPALPGTWTSHPVVRAAMNQRLSGRPDLEWLTWVKDSFFREPVTSALSLGCGGGYLEREAIRVAICRRILGIDVSAGAIRLAEERAAACGMTDITYRVADVNRVELPRGAYDLVLAKQSLHHLESLEHALDQVRLSLRQGGWFVINEYVGPARFQWPVDLLEIMDQLLAALPVRLRTVGSAVREQVERVPAEEIAAHDPSEAVRSDEIIRLVEERFEVLERRELGGTLLNPLLQGIVANFRIEDEDEVAMLRLLIAVETILLRRRVIPSDYVVLVTRTGS